MSKKNKLARFAENATFPHLFQVSFHDLQQNSFPLKGNWGADFFLNNNPIVLELGCGKGEYTVGMASENLNINHIGIDIKGARLWRGCKTIQESGLTNAAFIRTKIQNITHLFANDEVQEIWITFPDPQPGLSRERKRLTAPGFINKYRQIISPEGIIHLKTDDTNLYQYTLEVFDSESIEIIEHTDDLHNINHQGYASQITTFYEKIWLKQGAKIKYIKGIIK
jgi:tRNA (guanine-N7-)-methyltransferase